LALKGLKIQLLQKQLIVHKTLLLCSQNSDYLQLCTADASQSLYG